MRIIRASFAVPTASRISSSVIPSVVVRAAMGDGVVATSGVGAIGALVRVRAKAAADDGATLSCQRAPERGETRAETHAPGLRARGVLALYRRLPAGKVGPTFCNRLRYGSGFCWPCAQPTLRFGLSMLLISQIRVSSTAGLAI